MENEGIMALPGASAMQDGGARSPMTVSSADSYDAATTAASMVDPQALAALKESVRQNLSELQLTPAELGVVVEMFEYMSQRPDQYRQLVQQLVSQGIVDEGDMPEEYDPTFIGAILVALNELRMMQTEGAAAVMEQGPPVAEPAPLAMAQGGLADMAQYLASKGRNGDTMLAHITPEEATMLKRMGGSGTINPETGLPEFFLKKAFRAIGNVVKGVVNGVKEVLKSPVGRILGTIALATVLGPTAIGMTLGTAGTAALSAGAVTLAGGGTLKEALISGAMGYIGGGGDFGGLGSPLKAVGEFLPGAAGSALNTGLTTGALGAGAGLALGMKPAEALRMGALSGLVSGGLQAVSPNLSEINRVSPSQEAAIGTGELPGAAPAPTSQSPLAQAVAAPGAVGTTGGTGTAADLLARMPSSGMGGGQGLVPGSTQGFQAPSFGAQDFGAAAGGAAPTTNYSFAPEAMAPSMGIAPPTFTAADLSRAAGGAGATSNYSLTPRAAMSAATGGGQPGIIDRAIQGAKDIYGEYLSPNRPGLPADAGLLRRYAPLALAGTAVAAASGAMKSTPSNPNPLFDRQRTGLDYMRENPEMFRGGLDNPIMPPPPSMQTPEYARAPVGGIPVVLPTGITQASGGIAQPYNVAGLYGIPLIYGQPQGRAKGGEMRMEEFPRKTGPINGPGTGTSDSIPAMLSDGEFVFTAKAVRNAGGGSRRKGAARMYKLMKMLEGGQVKGK
jgi:hypothetical protein